MRRLPLAWVLSLLLVFAQHGAVLHELSHMQPGASGEGTSLRADLQLGDSVCPSCAAYSQVANPASGAASTLSACAPVLLPVPARSCAFVAVDAPTPRSRGPPQA